MYCSIVALYKLCDRECGQFPRKWNSKNAIYDFPKNKEKIPNTFVIVL